MGCGASKSGTNAPGAGAYAAPAAGAVAGKVEFSAELQNRGKADHEADDHKKFASGLLSQGGQGGRPPPLTWRLHRIPTHFPLHLLCMGSDEICLPSALLTEREPSPQVRRRRRAVRLPRVPDGWA